MPSTYASLAKYYDTIYRWKDYKKEVVQLLRLIARHKKSPGRDLLDVACGTGSHLVYLQKYFNCTGSDYSPQMLAVARKKLPTIKFHRADMAALQLGRQFDVITCLFSAIGSVRTVPRLYQTARVFARHLKPGGVLMIEPWIQPSQYDPTRISISTTDTSSLKLVRLNTCKRSGNISVLDLHYLVAEHGSIRHLTDRMELGLFSTAITLSALNAAGLNAQYLPIALTKTPGSTLKRGLYIAVKPLRTK